ncbi:MAG: MFS transporter [Deltaproteobacteria bacterium]|nr:MFS transporter [Deltaproteobacteria bacterium]MBW2382978.1 MFS transporter [Deltaproteobacteria bacterium]
MTVEEPRQESDPASPSRSRLIMGIVFATVLIDFIGFSILIPVLPEYADRLGANAFEIALIVAIYALTQLLFLPAWGWASDRFGRRPVILVSLSGTVASFILLAYAEDMATIYVSRILGGFFAASIGAAQAVITDLTEPSKRADGMGKIGAALGIAFVLGPALGGLLAGVGPKVPFHAVSAIAFVNLIMAWFFLPETRPIDEDTPRRGELLHSLVPTPIRMLMQVHDRRIGLYLYLWFHIYVGFAAVEGSFPLYLLKRYEATSLDVGIIFAWIGVFVALTQGILVGRLARSMKEGSMVIVGLVITAIGLVAITVTPSYHWLFVVGPIVAIGNGLAFPAFTSLYSQTCEARDAGELLGQGNSMGVSGRVVGAVTAGWVMDRFGLDSPFVVAGIVIFSGAIIFGAFHSILVPDRTLESAAPTPGAADPDV